MIRAQGSSLMATLLGVLLSFSPAEGAPMQDPRPDDANPRVAALSGFHEVIVTIWHTAWPNKDVALLRALLPDVERHTDSLRQAQLPGILRERQKAWNEQITRLLSIVKEYRDASAGGDTARILDAAEKLHGQYETLVRVTRPVMRELEEFHQVLYMLYHHYLPEGNQGKIASSVSALKEKMAPLEKAKLADRWKGREKAFLQARGALARSVARLDAGRSDPAAFAAAVESLHGEYQALERVFE